MRIYVFDGQVFADRAVTEAALTAMKDERVMAEG